MGSNSYVCIHDHSRCKRDTDDKWHSNHGEVPRRRPRRPSVLNPTPTEASDADDATQEELDEKPWKYIGYPGYSAYIASESDLQIFRRFRTAGSRIALRLQDAVAELEEQLELLDHKNTKRGNPDTDNGTFRYEPVDERDIVLEKLEKALTTYCEL